MGQIRFAARIRVADVDPYVTLTGRAAKAFPRSSQRKVRLRLKAAGSLSRPAKPLGAEASRIRRVGRMTADGWFRTTVIASRGGELRVFLNGWMRKSAGVDVGDRVEVTLAPDAASRSLRVHPFLSDAFKAHPRARRGWHDLTPSARREILSYINYLKSEAAVLRAVAKVVARLDP